MSLNQIPQAIIDIYYSHKENVFSLNKHVINLSQSSNQLLFEAFAERKGEWKTKLICIDDLIWGGNTPIYKGRYK